MKSLTQYILEFNDIYTDLSITEPDQPKNEIENEPKPSRGGIDILLAGEIRYYSESDHIFKDRKLAISDYYKNEIKHDMVWTADYIIKTPIFRHYIDDLIKCYKDNVDDKIVINVSTQDELERQLADDIILLSKNTHIR